MTRRDRRAYSSAHRADAAARRARRRNRQRGERHQAAARAVEEAQDLPTAAAARYARGESVGTCPPPCGKVAAPSLEAARTLRARVAVKKGDVTPVRFYECRATPGVWHWTRQVDRRGY